MYYYIFATETAAAPMAASHSIAEACLWAKRTLTDYVIRQDRRDRFTLLCYSQMPIVARSESVSAST